MKHHVVSFPLLFVALLLYPANCNTEAQLFRPKELNPQDLYNQAIKLLESSKGTPKDYGKDSIKPTLIKRLLQAIKGPFSKSSQENIHVEDLRHFKDAIELLEIAAKSKHSDSLFLLAKINMFALFSNERDFKKAFDYFSVLSTEYGNSTANFFLGVMYDNGLGTTPNHPLAILHHTFAAAAQNHESSIILANKYRFGINLKPDCEKSLKYYKSAAKRVIQKYKSGPVGGLDLPHNKPYIYIDEGGVYGESYITKKTLNEKVKLINDALEYEKYMASKGKLEYKLKLGILYYKGNINIRKNYKLAFYHLKDIANKATKIKEIKNDHEKHIAQKLGEACSYIGLMYLRGEAVQQNNKTAEFWFMTGAKLEDPQSMFWYGVLRYETYGDTEGFNAIEKSSSLGEDKASEYMGSYYYKKQNYSKSLKYYSKAEENGNFYARYMLADIYYRKVAVSEPCRISNALLKSTVERGSWLVESEKMSAHYYHRGDYENSLIHYLMLANMGFETAQANAAYILEKKKSHLNLFKDKDFYHALSYINWKQSSEQGNTKSTMKMGDHYFYGRGVSQNLKKAFSCYSKASYGEISPIAKWNVGYMYEHGYGAPKDYYLAKRSYDESLELLSEGYLPISLSLFWLNAKIFMKYVTERTLLRFRRNENENYFDKNNSPIIHEEPVHTNHMFDEEDPWKKWSDNDHHLQETRDQDHDDILQHLTENKEEFLSSTLNNFLILILCLLIAWLVYLRQYRLRLDNTNNRNNQN